MAVRVVLTLLISAFVVSTAAQERQRPAGPTVVVGPNIRASANTASGSGSRNEMWLSASATDPMLLVGVTQTSTSADGVGGSRGCATLLSRNGGQTWREIKLPKDESDQCFDPMTAAAADGRLYVMQATLGRNFGGSLGAGRPRERGTIRFWSTTDGGRTWTNPGEVACPVAPDHPRIVVDTTNGPHRGRLYVPWNEVSDTVFKSKYHILFSYSDDGGRTFSESQLLDGTEGGKFVILEPVVFSDGTLLVTYHKYFFPLANKENYHQPFYVLRSSDGGQTFSKPEKVGEFGTAAWLYLRKDLGRAWTVPVVIADTSATSRFRDRVYVVWDDTRDGTSNIVFQYSADKGKTWSTPRHLNDNPPPAVGEPPDLRVTPVVAVNKDGVLAALWYDRRDDPTHRCWKPYVTASFDGGETFLKNTPVATVASCPDKDQPPSVHVWNTGPELDDTLPTADEVAASTSSDSQQWREQLAMADAFKATYGSEKVARVRVAFDSGRGVWPGHYVGLTADPNGVFHALWADRRNKLQQNFAARLEVLPAPEPPAPPTQDATVTSLVQLVGGPGKFDEGKGTATFELQLRNVSDRPIYAPLRVRVTKVAAYRGAPTVTVVEPDGSGATGAPPAWDFSKLLGSRGRLDPKMISEAKTVTVKVAPDTGLDGAFDFEVIGHLARTVSSAQR